MRQYLLLLFSFFLFLTCSSDEEEGDYVTVLTVASERVLDCDVFTYGRASLLVREPGDKSWRKVPGVIGFDYERGYEYTLKVKVHMTPELMDAPDREYTLEQLVGKEEKLSENLPGGWTKWEEEWNGKRIPCR
jgi:hypothetical protein